MRTIDADALMEAINTWPKFGVNECGMIVPWDEGYEPYIHLRDAVIAITGMPTIEPQRIKGRWETDAYGAMDDGEYLVTRCNVCGTVYEYGHDDRYCGFCGADMRKE